MFFQSLWLHEQEEGAAILHCMKFIPNPADGMALRDNLT